MALVPADKIDVIELPGQVVDLDFTNDGSLLAVAMLSYGKGAVIRLYSTGDLSIVEEFGEGIHIGRKTEFKPGVFAGRGVAFCEGGKSLYMMMQELNGTDLRLYRAPLDGGKIEERGTFDVKTTGLMRDASGRLLGIVGNALRIVDLSSFEAIRYIESASPQHRIAASFAAEGPRLYIHGREERGVVLHDLTTNTDVAGWTVPFEFGAQVIASPSGRTLFVLGEHRKGALLLDTQTGQTLLPDYFDESSIYSYSAFSSGDSLFVTLLARVLGFRLPEGETVLRGPRVNAATSTAAVAARDAPIMAFGVGEDELAILRLVEGPGASTPDPGTREQHEAAGPARSGEHATTKKASKKRAPSKSAKPASKSARKK